MSNENANPKVIKRYSVTTQYDANSEGSYGYGIMEDDENGGYVSYEDYEKLKKEYEKIQTKLKGENK